MGQKSRRDFSAKRPHTRLSADRFWGHFSASAPMKGASTEADEGCQRSTAALSRRTRIAAWEPIFMR